MYCYQRSYESNYTSNSLHTKNGRGEEEELGVVFLDYDGKEDYTFYFYRPALYGRHLKDVKVEMLCRQTLWEF